VCACLALALAVASPAAAAPTPPSATQKETARGLMEAGDAKLAAGDIAGALHAYRSADAIMGVPTTSFAVARALVQLGQLVEAADAVARVRRHPLAPGEPAAFTRAFVVAAAVETPCDDGAGVCVDGEGGPCVECTRPEHCGDDLACDDNRCVPMHCNDSEPLPNGDETDVDCGGSCPPCTDAGDGCLLPADCAPPLGCVDGACGECSNNGDCADHHYCCQGLACEVPEGEECPCELPGECVPERLQGQTCHADTDCVTGHCDDGYCCDRDCGHFCSSCNPFDEGVAYAGTCAPIPDRTVCPGTLGLQGCCQGDRCVALNLNCK
jgi:hypothetical protein